SDVYMGTEQHYALMRANNAMKMLDWTALSEGRITADALAEGNIGVKISSRFVGVPYNINLVRGDDIPQQLSDVLNPKWKGRIVSTPYAAEFPALASSKMLGSAQADEFMRQLAPSVGGLIRCGEEQRVASGEFAMMVLSCGADPTIELKRGGAPIDHAIL